MIDLSNNEDLFIEIKRGNPKAFEHLYKRYFYRLRGYAIRYIENEETVQDIIQECFLRLWEKKEQLKPISISSLLFTMVRNCCINHLKYKTIKHQYSLEDCVISEAEERLIYMDFGLDASHKLLYEELQEQIDLIMHSLPTKCKEVFVLSREEGLKNREIAHKLQISTTAVEKHISKALTLFSVQLKEKYSTDICLIALLYSLPILF